jgi:hypothetical protein
MAEAILRRWSDGDWGILVADDERPTPKVEPAAATIWPRELSSTLREAPCPACGLMRPISAGRGRCGHSVQIELLIIRDEPWAIMFLPERGIFAWDLSEPEPVIGVLPDATATKAPPGKGVRGLHPAAVVLDETA